MKKNKHQRRLRKFLRQGGLCYWCKGQMTLELRPKKNGRVSVPRNYATFEHLQRKRDGGTGKHNNIVLACSICNNKREHRIQVSKPKPENSAARRMRTRELKEKMKTGDLTQQERGELYTRGLLPNWPMWSKIMSNVPLGNP